MSARDLETRLENLERAVANLATTLACGVSTIVEIAATVKMFELAYELAWKSLKASLDREGQPTQGPRDVIRTAWRLNVLTIGTEQDWLDIIKDRNETVHTYDEAFARAMVDRIRARHAPLLVELSRALRANG